MTGFRERLESISRANKSLVCIGLDPDPNLMAVPDVADFNRAIVDATADLVCAFKPNFPFYEALGMPGLRALEQTVEHIRSVAPDVVLLADGKRGDIGSTNEKYAQALFTTWGFDAATVNAYAGIESLDPFFEYADKGIIIWCRSSNPGAGDIQDIRVNDGSEDLPMYEWLAAQAAERNTHGNIGLVVGATYPEQLSAVRGRSPGLPILIPGIGAQGGALEESLTAGLDSGAPNVLISSSRGITYASRDESDFAEMARTAASTLRDQINEVLAAEGRPW
ncbi:MAG TPA: orotidine-5'-phosphate decarboxylase [SAR202 cluster bacterium]|nr:orotidine-5'-phosphate decarboxylase [SAR202 cluster bacterium]HJO81837.1 orotidine-5'-phosphate decarboxylase [SAR202 cluster bacterium]